MLAVHSCPSSLEEVTVSTACAEKYYGCVQEKSDFNAQCQQLLHRCFAPTSRYYGVVLSTMCGFSIDSIFGSVGRSLLPGLRSGTTRLFRSCEQNSRFADQRSVSAYPCVHRQNAADRTFYFRRLSHTSGAGQRIRGFLPCRASRR